MKICIMIMIVALVVIGCVSGQSPIQIQVDPDSQEIIAKIAARHIGFELQREYPDVAEEVLIISKEILLADKDKNIVNTLIDRLIFVLTNGVSDHLLAMDIRDLVLLIDINTGMEITEEQMKTIKSIAKGLVSGIEAGNRLCRNVEDVNIKIGE